MIVKMKKISLLMFHSEKELFLRSLQGLGIVHIEISPEITSVELERAIELKSRYERTIKALKGIKRSKSLPFIEGDIRGPEAILDDFDALLKRLKVIRGGIKEMELVAQRLTPWGDFDPQNIEKLGRAGIATRLFEVSQKQFDALDLDGLNCSIINRDNEKVYLVVFDRDGHIDISIPEVRLPSTSLGMALERMRELKREKVEIESSMESLASHIKVLMQAEAGLEDRVRFIEAGLHMKEEAGGRLFSMTGWLTYDKEEDVRSFLDEYTSCYEIKDPESDESVPVLLKNNRFSRLFEPVTRIFSLPAYFELDPTPFFAPFFALFFGLCLADLGYGLIVTLLSALLFIKGPESFKPLSALGMVLGLLTIVGGLLLNTFFGQAIFRAPGVENAYFSSSFTIAPLGAYIEDGQMLFPAMTFALMLGFGQVVFAMFLQSVNRMRSKGLAAAVQPFSCIMMTLGGLIVAAHADVMGLASLRMGPLPLGEWIRACSSLAGNVLLWGGLLALLLFNNPHKGILLRPALGMWELYGFATGLMGDILSYLRLFALGLAGGLLGNAVNRIAFMIITDDAGMINYSLAGTLGTIAVLVLGHTLNMAIAALGGFVHSLRLTFVEFYKNLKFEGGSKAFEPFSLQNRN